MGVICNVNFKYIQTFVAIIFLHVIKVSVLIQYARFGQEKMPRVLQALEISEIWICRIFELC